MQTVYVDVLILTNFIIDFFLLKLSLYLLGKSAKSLRLVLSAFLASLSSLLIFAPELNFFFEFAIKLIISFLVVFSLVGRISIKPLFKITLVFYASNIILAGGAIFLWEFLGFKNIVVRNSSVFINISPLTLVLTTAAVYGLALIVSKIISRRRLIGGEISVTLKLFDKKVTVKGMIDSGNMLKDILSGAPVIVCSFESVKSLFDSELIKIFSKNGFEKGFYGDIVNSKYSGRLRIIPVNTVNGSSVLSGVVLDNAEIHLKNQNKRIEKIVMAVTHEKICDGEFSVLLSPELVLI